MKEFRIELNSKLSTVTDESSALTTEIEELTKELNDIRVRIARGASCGAR